MKTRFKYLLLSSFIFLVFSMQAQEDTNKVSKEVFIQSLEAFPSLGKVANWFFLRYKTTDENRNIRFAKDPRGWYVYESNPAEQGYIYNKQQIWSLDQLAFRETNYRPVEDKQKAKENFQDFMRRQESRLYKIHPFYGYNGWDRDVIHNLKVYENLPDTLIYGLARAYSNFALSAIRHQYAYSASDHKPAGYEKISAKRLNIFTSNMNKSLAEYKKLIRSNPEFQTIVGSIKIKYNNELMFAWHNLLSVKAPEKAKKYIKKVNYNQAILSIGKNYLNSVDKNGILFTNGDNDTYPLWYLQEQENFRDDILVINTSLLQSSWYTGFLHHAFDKTNRNNLLSFTESDFDNSKREIIYNIPKLNTNKFMSLKNVIRFIKDDENVFEVSSSRDVFYMPTLKFRFPVSKSKLLVDSRIPDEYKVRLIDTLQWTSSRSYITRSELLIMDILSNNQWKYPIHFAVAGNSRLFNGLSDYMKLEGLAYRFIPAQTREKNKTSMAGFINVPKSFQLYAEKFDYKGFQKKSSVDHIPDLFIRNLRRFSVSTASALMGRNKKDSARQLLELIDKALPNKLYTYDFISLSHAELFLQLEDTKKAREIIQSVASDQMKEIRHLNRTPANSPKVKQARASLQVHRKILNNIIQLCSRYNLPELKKQYSDFLKQSNH